MHSRCCKALALAVTEKCLALASCLPQPLCCSSCRPTAALFKEALLADKLPAKAAMLPTACQASRHCGGCSQCLDHAS